MSFKMKGFSGFNSSPCGCVGKCKCASPNKQVDNEPESYGEGHKKVMKDGAKNTTHFAKNYWYKINGKKCSKAQYLAYKNKPGGDEKGKQTNDPNVSLAKKSGNKRKTPLESGPLKQGGTADGNEIINGELCDAYGNKKPSKKQIEAGLATANFKTRKGK